MPPAWAERLGIDVGDAPGGYGWLFPKGDHVNLGVCGWRDAGPILRDHLTELTRFYGFDPADLRNLRGHHLPVRAPDAPLVEGNVLLVGDAAGLLDPFTGEGIYAAVWSGGAAARAIAGHLDGRTPDVRGYENAVVRELSPDQEVAWLVRDLFHLSPAVSFTLMSRVPALWPLVCRLVRGEQTYAGAKRALGPAGLGFDLAAYLVRATPRLRRRAAIHDPVPPLVVAPAALREQTAS